jgi:hypothetical protein
MELSKVRANQLSRPSEQTSKEDAIEILLATLAVARQAKIGKPEYDLYTPILMPYELKHISQAIKALSLRVRAEGETAFPAVASILEEVRGIVRAQRATAALDAENARVAHFKAHPELYETPAEVKEFAAMVAAKFGMGGPR